MIGPDGLDRNALRDAAVNGDPRRPVGVNPAVVTPASILVVDDTEANRDVLSRRLVRQGYAVTTASGGAIALSEISKRQFDLVLLDVMMPGVGGLEVLVRLRETHSPTDLPIIMATAKDQSEDIVRALNLGANDYVMKPLDFPVVLARVQTQLALKKSVELNRELERRLSQRNAELEAAAERIRVDLKAAARIQESYLPKSLQYGTGMHFAWTFKPCEALAGDSLNICPLDPEHVGVYVLDVVGHGVAGALQAVTATRFLSPATDPDSLLVRRESIVTEAHPVPPAEVARRLNEKFAWDEATGQYLTLFYLLIQVETGHCRYVCAGHPAAIHLPHGAPPAALGEQSLGLPIGIGEVYEDYRMNLHPGDRLYLYTDGVTEAMNPAGELFGKARLLETLDRGRGVSLDESISMLTQEIVRWCASAARDDLSVLAVERESF